MIKQIAQRTRVLPGAAAAGALTGLLATAAAIGVAELVAGITGSAGEPVIAVGSAAIDLTPVPVKDFAIQHFGSHDKMVLLAGIYVMLALFAMLIGIMARRGWPTGWPGWPFSRRSASRPRRPGRCPGRPTRSPRSWAWPPARSCSGCWSAPRLPSPRGPLRPLLPQRIRSWSRPAPPAVRRGTAARPYPRPPSRRWLTAVPRTAAGSC